MAVLDDDANGMLEYEEVVDVLEGNFNGENCENFYFRKEEYWPRKGREIQEGND